MALCPCYSPVSVGPVQASPQEDKIPHLPMQSYSSGSLPPAPPKPQAPGPKHPTSFTQEQKKIPLLNMYLGF